MTIENIENIMKLALVSNMMKNTSSDSGVFDIVMYSLLKSIDNNESYIEAPLNNSKDASSILEDNLKTSVNDYKVNYDKVITDIKNISTKLDNKNIDSKVNIAIKNASQKYGIDENLIKAIIKKESSFNPKAVSSAGAKGLMQIMPFNFKSLGITDPFNIEQNIEGGTKLLKQYIDKFDGNLEMGLMAYNAGPGTIKKRGVNAPHELYKMPKETQNYVPKVMSYYRSYKV